MKVTIEEMSHEDCHKVQALLNLEDADAEIVLSLKNKEKNLFSVFADGKLVGAAKILSGKKSYLYVFVDPSYRNKGIGFKACKLCEEKIHKIVYERIMTTYRIDNPCAKEFANKLGYIRNFSSVFMKYTGDKFHISKLPIREYCDEDYEAAHEMYARAFHEMRLRVGDFPGSVIELPSSKMRKYWAETKNERLVYVKNGEIAGYVHLEGNYIGSISVKPENQGQGIGRSLMKYICNKILSAGYNEVCLHCVTGNFAKNLYDSLEFKEMYAVDYAIKKRESKTSD